MRNMLVFLGGVAVILVVAVGLYQWHGTPTLKLPQPQVTTAPASMSSASVGEEARVKANDFVIGSPNAPVTMIEYASLTCSHCANFHINVRPKLKSTYVDSGKVRLVYRDFPLDGLALRASMLARCSGHERFFGILNILFKRQEQWAGNPDPLAALARVVALGGMGTSDFQACLKNKKVEDQILAQRQMASKAFAIDSTPSFIFNGQKISVGGKVENFKAIIDPLIAKAGK